MVQTYTAFALALRSSFPLPGMVPAAGDGLPSLVLDLETPEELQAAWSGAPASSRWRGRLGDGEDLTIEWGTSGDLLFAYGDRARYRLDASGSRLGCAPKDAASLDWQRVLLNRVLPNVSLSRGREALHASAVETPDGAIAVAAPSGMGKSTLASELMRRGWPLFADDVLVLSRGPDAVEAHPSGPHMNVAMEIVDAVDPELGTTLGVLAGERWIAARAASRKARQVAAIVLLERGPKRTLEAQPLPASPLTLAPYMLGHLADDDGRKADRFSLYSDLVESAKLVRLTGGVADGPRDLADLIERTFDLSGPAAVKGAA